MIATNSRTDRRALIAVPHERKKAWVVKVDDHSTKASYARITGLVRQAGKYIAKDDYTNVLCKVLAEGHY